MLFIDIWGDVEYLLNFFEDILIFFLKGICIL